MKRVKLPVREIIFGLEDGTVSTLGILVGIAIGTNNKSLVVLSGLVVIFVESLSMAAGTYLSNKSQQEVHLAEDKKSPLKSLFHRHKQALPLKESVFMGASYILGGIISLTSFLIFPVRTAVISAVLASFVFLFIIGFVKGKLAQINSIKSGLEMVLVSASASFIGYVVGRVASTILSIN